MKPFREIALEGTAALGVLAGLLFLAGCQTNPPQWPDFPGNPADSNSVTRSVGNTNDVLRVGDAVAVTLTDLSSDKVFPTYSEHVKDDGTITPPYIGSVLAAGKTTGELQRQIQAKYDALYKNTTATVNVGDRYYYVEGEVKQSGPKLYLGQTDIVKAISAAGGFTDFAKKSKVRLIHPNGKYDVVDYNEVINDATQNVIVYPGDKVYVPRRFW